MEEAKVLAALEIMRTMLKNLIDMLADAHMAHAQTKQKLAEAEEKIAFQTITAEPCPICGKSVHWMLAPTGAEAFCSCGWNSLDASKKEEQPCKS